MGRTKRTHSAAANPLDGLVFSASGTLSKVRREFQEDVESAGGEFRDNLTNAVTHLITTEGEYDRGVASKVARAKGMGINIVSEDLVLDSIAQGKLLDDDKYFFQRAGAASTASSSKTASGRPQRAAAAAAASKSTNDDDDDEEEEEEEEPVAQPPRKKAKTTSAVEEEASSASSSSRMATIRTKGKAAVDQYCSYASTGMVYEDADGLFNAMLNQTNIAQNNNKFYVIQVIKTPSGYATFTRWGRVGERGAMDCKTFSNAQQAKALFMSKFKDKTGNHWSDRDDFVSKKGKYDMIDVSYASDEEEEEDAKEPGGADDKDDDEDKPERNSALHERVQDLMRLIANVDEMKAQMKEFEIDLKRMPLGKLSKAQIKAGYEILKDLQEAIKRNDRGECSELSSEFYTKIPHDFGRMVPPVISTVDALQKKIKMLESLADLEIASKLLAESKEADSKHPIDSAYESMRCEIRPLDRHSYEWSVVENLVKSGAVHDNYELELEDVYVVEREGEKERFEKTKHLGNRRLLWHGSRTSNFMGILSQGLRIAPPEAPSTGYMFGKGVYLADLCTKSANYCFTTPQKNTGLMLLCEASLGSMYERLQAEFVTKLPAGFSSTWGKGKTIPDPSGNISIEDGITVPAGRPVDVIDNNPNAYALRFNEFIVYDTAQVRLRYLLKLKFNYGKKSVGWY